MRADGHAGLNMDLAAPVIALYPGSLHDVELWLWFAAFVCMSTWPDIDLKFELKHRGFTHTLAGALLFGVIGALLFGLANPAYALSGFLGGFLGTLGHMLGDLPTYAKFRPLWPVVKKEYGLGLFRASDPEPNRAFAKLGASLMTIAVMYRVLAPALKTLIPSIP